MTTPRLALVLMLLWWLSVLILGGCASAPVWETAEVECVDYANAACRAALEQDIPAGVVVCTMPGERVRHAVTWVTENGVTRYYDPSFGCYRTRAELGTIHWQVAGPSRGAWDICPLPGEKK